MAEKTVLTPVALAPVERLPNDIIKQQAQWFIDHAFLSLVLNSLQEMVLVTNSYRQIVYANQNTLNYTGFQCMDDVIGKRPGELLGCRHAFKTETGCGTTRFCHYCGAARVLASAINGVNATDECHIAGADLSVETTLDLRVGSAPVPLNDETFVVFSLTDISDQNRRRQLERIFFHDVMNTAGIIHSATGMMVEEKYCDENVTGLVYRAANRLIDQIASQRELSDIEGGDYTPTAQTVNAMVLLQELLVEYSEHEVAKDKTLHLDNRTTECTFEVDQVQLTRVLGNMVKNALEASEPGQTITAGSVHNDTHVEFWVHNDSFMPEAVQVQIFNRSFTTKGSGRGLGTYSMRLLSEVYLEGTVSFVTSQDTGTIFRVRYPRQPSYAEEKAIGA